MSDDKPSDQFIPQPIIVTLGKYVKPSAWDRLLRDDPLAPIKGKWEGGYNCNVTSTGAITIPVGTIITNGSTNFVVMAPPQVHTITLGYVLPSKKKHSGGMANPWPRETLPYPRNRCEERTFSSIQNRLPELIERAEKKFGSRFEGLESEWNARFWEMVTPVRDRDHFLKTRK